jgi:hypothetical protein
MTTRICKVCGEEKTLDREHFFITNSYYDRICSECKRAQRRLYKLKNKEKIKAKAQVYYKKHSKKFFLSYKKYSQTDKGKISISNSNKKYRANNREKLRISSKTLSAQYRKELPDHYIISEYFSKDRDTITPELIEAKRQQLLLYRTIKQLDGIRKESNHT